MTFLPTYYRSSYYSPKENTPLLGGTVSKVEMREKLDRNLDTIYKSSAMLKALKFKDTESLYDILSRNGKTLNPLVQSNQQEKKEVQNVDIEMVDVEDEQNEEASSDINPRGQLNQKISVSELKTKNKKLMISLTNFPTGIIKYESLIENFIEFCILNIFDCISKCKSKESGEDILINPGFKWYSIHVKETLNQDVFVVFEDAIMMYLFIQLINDNIEFKENEKLKITNDKVVNDEIIPKIQKLFFIEETRLTAVKPLIDSRLKELISISNKTNEIEKSEQHDDYLTNIKKISENYTINAEDLVDVPAYMIDSIKQYIIDFRIHVLKDLEKKQKQRELKEQEDLSNKTDEIKINGSNDAIKVDENMRNMSDIEFERMSINKEKSLIEKNYYIKLGKYKKSEEIRLKKYYNYLNFIKHESYLEKVISSERKKFLTNFVNNVIDENNKIDLNFNYYVKHSNYEKYRLNAKKNEEKSDELIDLEENEITSENDDETQESKVEISNNKDLHEHIEQTKVSEQPSKNTKSDSILEDIVNVLEKHAGFEINSNVEFINTYIKNNLHDSNIDKRSRSFKLFKQGISDITNKPSTPGLNAIIDDLYSLYR